MAGRIPQNFIDDLVNRIDIVDLVESRVPLKKAGREYAACCPFHSEKTPSFYVNREKQFYHCFGCGAHGTAIGFLMEYEHLGFVEAVEELARQAGVEVPREGGHRPPRPEERAAPDLYEAMEAAAKLFQGWLRRHPDAPQAVEYLKGRGLSGEIAKEFGIGYAPPGWDNLLKALGGSPAREKNLLLAGLLIEKEGTDRRYDRFRERVMFPIRDRRGRVIAFGGRVLGQGEPKYLNSPETPIFHKGRELYGLWEAQQALRKFDRLMVVEGYMDVVSLAQFDIRYAVATLGTATTPEHLERLFRTNTPEVVFCFDGDRAGRQAAWRALDNALPAMGGDRLVRFLFLPEGEDPDTLVRKEGKEAFEARLAHAPTLSEYLLDALAKKADMNSLEGPARLLELARPLLAKVPRGPFRENLLLRLADRARMDPTQVARMTGGTRPQPPHRPEPHPPHDQPPPFGAPSAAPRPRAPIPFTARSLAEKAAALLLHRPELALDAGDPGRLLQQEMPGAHLLAELLGQLQAEPGLGGAALMERWRGSGQERLLAELFASVEIEKGIEKEFTATIQEMDRQRRQRRYDELWRASARGLTEEEKEELRALQSALRGSK